MYNISMIGFLKGIVHAFTNDYVLLDVNGVGYRISFKHPDLLEVGKEITIYTYQSVSENDMSLFGFRSLEEYDLFIKLISVKGLGPKMASNMLALAGYETIIQAIEKEDIAYIKTMPGIGAKTASQIILDLRGKLTNDENIDNKFKDVVDALKQLGYKVNEIKPVLKKLASENLDDNEYIKKALKLLKK